MIDVLKFGWKEGKGGVYVFPDSSFLLDLILYCMFVSERKRARERGGKERESEKANKYVCTIKRRTQEQLGEVGNRAE